MNLKKISTSITILLISFLSVEFSYIENSEAGILFRNRQNVIRVGGVQSNMQQYRVRRSTSIMKNTGGSKLRAKSFGGVPSTMKLVVSNVKYEQKLAKWEDKKFKQNLKLKQKKEALEKKEQKRRELLAKRLEKQNGKTPPNLQIASKSQPGQITSSASNPSSRGALGTGSAANQNQPKKGFWASLLQALFGKSA